MSSMQNTKKREYISLPYQFLRDGENPVSKIRALINGLIYTYELEKRVCKIGYGGIAKRLHVSKSGVCRNVQALKEDSRFSVERRGQSWTTYEFIGDGTENRAERDERVALSHMRVEDYFFSIEITINGRKRLLTRAEVFVLALIYTHTYDEKHFTNSYSGIAGILGYRPETVWRAMQNLMDAGLVYVKAMGKSKSKKSSFGASMSNLRKVKKERKKREQKEKKKPVEIKYTNTVAQTRNDVIARNEAIEAMAERERFYSLRQARAERIADEYKAYAIKKIPQLKELFREERILEIQAAKAELKEPERLPAVEQQQKGVRAQIVKLLSEINMTRKDLEKKSHCMCRKCSDSGYLPNGRACDCYTPPTKRSEEQRGN